jgi:alpha-L-fucosidase
VHVHESGASWAHHQQEKDFAMSTDWLNNDLWRAHVSWVTDRWVESTENGQNDFDAVQWLDQIQSAHYQTLIFYAKFHNGYCNFPSRLTDYCAPRDFLGECTAEARKRGLRVMTYYSTFIDQAAGNKHPDWQVKARDGKRAESWPVQRWPDSYCCLNSGYRDHLLGQITELSENYRPDGLWLDVYEPLTAENCFCPACQAKYRAQTGGSIFDTRDNRWYQDCHTGLLSEINALIKRINPDCVLGQNCGVRHPQYDPIDDFFTREAFTAPAISLYCRSMRPLGRPFETTSRLYTSVHSWAVRSPERVLLEALATVVHGGASSMELSPAPTGRIYTEAVCRVAEAGAYIRAIEPYLLDTQPVYDAGVFQQDWLCGGPWGTTTPPGGWMSALMERDVPHACLYPDADLSPDSSPYRLVILDDTVVPDEALAARLADYVARGGRLIVECGAAFGNPGAPILQQVLGITGQGKTGGVAHYLSGLDGRIAGGLGEDDLIVEGEAYRIAASTAGPLAYYRYELTERQPITDLYYNLPPRHARSGDPAITLNPYGQGSAMYVACPLTTLEILNHRNNPAEAREYPTQLAANLARFMLGEPLLRGTTPAGVEVVVNRQAGRHVVHLLNQYISGQYYDSRRGVLKLADVPLAINEKRTGAIKRAVQVSVGQTGIQQTELPIRRDGAWAEVRLAQLGVHALIVFEH